jgi:hypothetical protein
MLGVVGFVSDLPLFLLVPFAGVLVDRLLFGAIAGWVGTRATLMIGGTVCLIAMAALPPHFHRYGEPAVPSMRRGIR